MQPPSRNPAIPYLMLFAALYAGFGVQSPFLPALLKDHGLAISTIGIALAVATATRLVAGPIAARLADRYNALRLVFAICAAGAAAAVILYVGAQHFWPLLGVSLLQAAMLAPLAQLGDAMVLGSAVRQTRGVSYGWVRGAGSAAFIAGSLLSGHAIERYGIGAIIWLNAVLLSAAAALAPTTKPLTSTRPAKPTASGAGVGALLALPAFRRIIAVAALILGSHALHDGFAVIRWNAAGIGSGAAGMLWSEAVAAEVIVFFALGRPLLDWLGPAGVAIVAAFSGIVRWSVSAETAWLPALAMIQPLHGVTFALLHLACMRRLAETVPPHLEATARALYGIVGIGAATAVLTLLSGWLYGAVGASGFWIMALLCLAALPVARRL
jgi:PPP family 3-phenylpropionic acid transporter